MPSSLWRSSSRSTTASCCGGVFDLEIVEHGPGILVFRAIGKEAQEVFKNEAGGHRWQRIPPSEKRGRVHTSTITVAVLPEPTEAQVRIDPKDIEDNAIRGSGPGGQNRNQTNTCVVLKHVPSGIVVRVQNERSQHQNRATAMALLRARLLEREQTKLTGDRDDQRKQQVGSGMRGDKRRTIRCQDGTVKDHLTGQHWSFRDYERGNW